MFRLMKLRPPHGWQAVWWELAIVTLGVLIALFAEQLISGIKARSEVAEFRAATKEEIATNLYAYQRRVQQSPCVVRRIADLERWRDEALKANGRARSLTEEIGRPAIFSIRTAIWDSRGNTVANMPLDERLNYAEIYAVILSNQQAMFDEREAWRSLSAFNGATELTSVDVMRLNELLYRAKSINRNLTYNWRQALDFGERLGVKPNPGRRRAYLEGFTNDDFCHPLLSTSEAGSA